MPPPDIILVNHSLVLFGLFVLLAPRLREWAHRPRVFAATVKAGLVSMTIYLWHMLVLVAWLSLLHLVGWDLPTRVQANLVLPDGLPYWIGLIPVACGFVAVLYVIVRFLWPLEHMNLFWFDADVTRASSTTRSAIGVAMLALGLLTISGTGFSGFPVAVQQAYGIALSCSAALVVVLIALALLRQPKTHELSHTTDDQPR